MDRLDLLSLAVQAGGVYAAARIALAVFYPPVAGLLWQCVLGPAVTRRWPTASQAEDDARYSYMPASAEQPLVVRYGLFPAPVGDLTQGLRDGLLLGVFVALLPDAFTPAFLTLLLMFCLGRGAWRITRAQSAAGRVDAAFQTLREVLMFVAAVEAVRITGLFEHMAWNGLICSPQGACDLSAPKLGH